ncbi:MAG: cation diffusion facilitator family transporter [Nanoarchaeota archaeon]|nr:cation diffusion facilitator family transporter [Nanoarchaeota archaeon]
MSSAKKEHPSAPGIRMVFVGIAVNAFLAVVKGITGVLGNSYALVADAIESTSDIFTSIGVYLGLKIAAKPADANHPYGHGKAEPLSALGVAVALGGAGIIIAVQSIREVINPHHAPAAFTLWVLAAVILVKEVLFRKVLKTGEITSSIAVKTDAWHHRSDAITSAAAFIGISIALIGGPGFESADDFAALFASGIIFLNAYFLARPAVAELMDETPSGEIDALVKSTALSVRGVKALDKVFVRKIGFDYYVDLHTIVDGSMSVRQGHNVAHRVKNTIRESNSRIVNVLVHIEPYIKKKALALSAKNR